MFKRSSLSDNDRLYITAGLMIYQNHVALENLAPNVWARGARIAGDSGVDQGAVYLGGELFEKDSDCDKNAVYFVMPMGESTGAASAESTGDMMYRPGSAERTLAEMKTKSWAEEQAARTGLRGLVAQAKANAYEQPVEDPYVMESANQAIDEALFRQGVDPWPAGAPSGKNPTRHDFVVPATMKGPDGSVILEAGQRCIALLLADKWSDFKRVLSDLLKQYGLDDPWKDRSNQRRWKAFLIVALIVVIIVTVVLVVVTAGAATPAVIAEVGALTGVSSGSVALGVAAAGGAAAFVLTSELVRNWDHDIAASLVNNPAVASALGVDLSAYQEEMLPEDGGPAVGDPSSHSWLITAGTAVAAGIAALPFGGPIASVAAGFGTGGVAYWWQRR